MQFPIASVMGRIGPREQQDNSFGELEGAAARRERIEQARRRILGRVVALLSAVLLAMILLHLPDVDAGSLVRGPGRNVLLASLGADAAACVLIFVARIRSRSVASRI